MHDMLTMAGPCCSTHTRPACSHAAHAHTAAHTAHAVGSSAPAPCGAVACKSQHRGVGGQETTGRVEGHVREATCAMWQAQVCARIHRRNWMYEITHGWASVEISTAHVCVCLCVCVLVSPSPSLDISTHSVESAPAHAGNVRAHARSAWHMHAWQQVCR